MAVARRVAALKLLDLAGEFATRLGASMAIHSGRWRACNRLTGSPAQLTLNSEPTYGARSCCSMWVSTRIRIRRQLTMSRCWRGRRAGRSRPTQDIPAQAGLPSNLRQLPLAIAGVVVLGPFSEELIFHGLLLDWLKQRMAVWPAALIVSLLFAFIHNISFKNGI